MMESKKNMNYRKENAQPLISIITPSYNQGHFIEDTILSVLGQTYKNIEYIIVDGGSTDSTMEVVTKFIDKIDIIIHEIDEGQADAINKGFKLAKGELVGWINSDDILYPECVEKIVELFAVNPDSTIFYHSWLDLINKNGNLIKRYQHIIPDYNHLLRANYNVIQQGSFYKFKNVSAVGFLDKKNHYCMDLDLWLNLLKTGNIVSTKDKSYSAFRIYNETKTSTGNEKFLQNIYNVLRKHGARWYYFTIWKMIFVNYIKLKIKNVLIRK